MSTVKHLSYAGITLPLATPQLEEWLARIHPQTTFQDWEGWNFDGFDLEALPTPPLPRQPPFKIGVLHWPTGASRPAWFHAVVTTSILNMIRDAIGSNPMTPQSLVMYDGRTGKTITASMYMLPARPLNQLGHDSSDSWLLTLTDQRFFWPWKRGVINGQPVSWAALYTTIGNMLGLTITPDTISSDYGSPSRKWVGYYRPTPALLDAVATQIGQRVVVSLDGTVTTKNWYTAKEASYNYIQNATVAPSSGGQVQSQDISRYVPYQIDVLFASGSNGITFATGNCCSELTRPYVVSEYLGSLGLSASGYGDASGLPSTSNVLFSDLPYDGTNTTSVNDYATRAAQDWYGWRLNDPDIVYAGIEPWVPTGWEDYIEWTIQKLENQPFSSTLIRREYWNDFESGSWNAGLVTQTVQSSGDSNVGCGWIAGLATGECLELTLGPAYGRCSTLDTSQTAILVWGSGNGKWCSEDEITYPGPASPGTICFWLDDCIPKMTLDDNCLVYLGCEDGRIAFSGGSTALCTGTSVECNNYFLAYINCVCCSITGWNGPGWYCIDTGSGCPGVCVYLLEEDRCNSNITICGVNGPYASQELCEADCTSNGITTTCCPSDEIPTVLYAHVTATGTYAPINGNTYPLTYNVSTLRWEYITVINGSDFQIILTCIDSSPDYWELYFLDGGEYSPTGCEDFMEPTTDCPGLEWTVVAPVNTCRFGSLSFLINTTP